MIYEDLNAAVQRDIVRYSALCVQYNEPIQYWGGFPNCYGKHAVTLTTRSERETSMSKFNFYTQDAGNSKFIGLCKELPALKYGPVNTRSAALSGVKRAQKNLFKQVGAAAKNTKQSSRKVNRVVFVIDRSGSMDCITNDSLKSLNDNIKALREAASQSGQEYRISVVTFDSQIETIRSNQDSQTIEPVRRNEIAARGMTALYDATGSAINSLKIAYIAPGEDTAYLVIVITDGQENSSRQFSKYSLKDLMRKVTATDRWTLTFLLPPGAKQSFVSNFGIADGNVAEWEATTAGVQAYTQSVARGIQSYTTSRSMGLNSVKSFYTDLSGVTAKQVKKSLDDLSNNMKTLQVDKETEIRDFVEAKLGAYVPGSAFYQLTKDEKKVQDYKQLLVMEKGKKAVYGGEDARSVLGIPDGTLRIKPGNHGNFDIFVQSTSNNRKLVRGSKLLVDTTILAPPPGLTAARSQAQARKKY